MTEDGTIHMSCYKMREMDILNAIQRTTMMGTALSTTMAVKGVVLVDKNLYKSGGSFETLTVSILLRPSQCGYIDEYR